MEAGQEIQPHESKYGTSRASQNAPRTLPKVEPPNHVIGDTPARPRTQTYPAASLSRQFDLSPIDTLIGIKVRCGLRRQIPSRRDIDTGVSRIDRNRVPNDM